jgi:hypothetical protein
MYHEDEVLMVEFTDEAIERFMVSKKEKKSEEIL